MEKKEQCVDKTFLVNCFANFIGSRLGMFKSEIHRVQQCNNHLCLCSETFIKHWAEGINNFHWIEMMFIWRVACDFGVSLVMAAKECVCNTYYPFRFR